MEASPTPSQGSQTLIVPTNVEDNHDLDLALDDNIMVVLDGKLDHTIHSDIAVRLQAIVKDILGKDKRARKIDSTPETFNSSPSKEVGNYKGPFQSQKPYNRSGPNFRGRQRQQRPLPIPPPPPPLPPRAAPVRQYRQQYPR
ncbi:hypothetical protein EVAR_17078_1 [Eumeta japonica]|uniref:Uncharacterized protein n=1 Tax=Eumeta variegata TaxID=151549 RepID=A0A4C1V5G4_EUMVA|nr:hypothetical protein EVAR_17078_1 [Eumeta japonica]